MKIHRLTLGPVETNCYIVGDEASRECIVVDPSDDAALIVKTAEGWTIREIWLTHTHFDHILALRDLKEATGAAIRMHADALPLLRNLPAQMQRFFGTVVPPAPEPETFISAGDTLMLAAQPFEIRFTPGHAPGHVIFINHANKLVLCGDDVFLDSIGRTDLPGGNYAELMTSIESQILTLPDDYNLLPGHGPQTTIWRERTENPFIREWLDR